MKKAIAALMVLSMLLSAVAVAEAADVTGTWYLNEMQMEGQSFNPADFGYEITMELKDDGTAQLTAPDEDPQAGTWTLEGDKLTVTVDDEPLEMTLADGTLTVEQDGMGMVFGREHTESPSFEPAAPVEAAQEDFAGTWVATKIGMDGAYYDVSLLTSAMGGEGDITAVIEGTTITLNGFLFSNTSLPLQYADGALSFSGTDEAGSVGAITVRLLEDGMLAVELEATGSSFVFYMTAA